MQKRLVRLIPLVLLSLLIISCGETSTTGKPSIVNFDTLGQSSEFRYRGHAVLDGEQRDLTEH